jgi:hypothetical protein
LLVFDEFPMGYEGDRKSVMRTNLPVTESRYFLKECTSSTCTTDLQGNTTHVNSCFAQASNFTPDELSGSTRNRVRHPALPAQGACRPERLQLRRSLPKGAKARQFS